MKNYYIFILLLFPFFSSAQLKEIAFAELTAGSNMFFGAQMTPTTITVTVQGPQDRFLAFGFGTGMANGNDAIIWSTLGTGAAPLQLRDHRMIGTGSEPSVDAQQDWNVTSNTTSGGNRTIVATRALSTGDANDVTFNFAATTQNLFWAKGPSATNQLQNHGGSNRASGIVRNWVTVDQTPPTLSSTIPADNAVGVTLTQNLIMNFNENVFLGAGSFYLYDASNTLIQSVSSGGPGLSTSGNTIVWNPTANLVLNTSYYVQFDANTVRDAANNFHAGISDNTTWNFNTNDVNAPVLIANPFVPADNAVGVAVTQNLSVTFNEPIVAGSGNIMLFDNTNTLVESFDVATSPQVSIAGNTLNIDPTNDLILNTQYYIHIPSGVVSDPSGNVYTGFVINTTWNWNTNDLIAPTMLSPTVPADGEVNVDVSPLFSVTFNEDVQLNASGSLDLYNSTGVLVESFNQGSSNINVVGPTVSFTASANLGEMSSYYINISNNFISDLMNNNFAGFTDQTTWNFTTGDFTLPTITTLDPLDNATDVNPSFIPVFTFTEDVQLGGGNIYLVNENTQTITTYNSGTGNITLTNNSVQLNISGDLGDFEPYHILIENNAISDLNGNFFDGIGDTTTWNFVTNEYFGLDEMSFEDLISWNGTQLTIKVAFESAELLDMNGKIVRKIEEKISSLHQLSEGVYMLSIKTNGQQPKTLRIYVN